jgi:catalase
MFWTSMSPPEQDHIVDAFSFELGKCLEDDVKDRMLANLARVDTGLCAQVAAALGKRPPSGKPAKDVAASPALSLIPTEPTPTAGRVVGILAADQVDSPGLATVRRALERSGAVVVVIAPHGGTIAGTDEAVPVTKSLLTTQSVEYDALIVAGGPGADTVGSNPYTAVNLGEAYRHHKTIAAWGDGRAVLEACGIAADAAGVVTATTPNRAFATNLIESIGWHRHWSRV